MAYNAEKVAAHFDSESRFYDRLLALFPGYSKSLDALIKLVPPGERLLDLGTGTGILALNLAKSYKKVVGIDISPQMIELCEREARARNVSNCEFEVSDMLDLNFTPGSFDTITSAYVFHHLEDNLKRQVFRKACASLRPSGSFLVCDYMNKRMPRSIVQKTRYITNEACRRVVLFFEGDLFNTDEHPSSPEEYHKMLSESGFKHIEVTNFETNSDCIFKCKS